MAKKRSPSPDAERTVTPERAARLHRLLSLLASGRKTRDALRRQLRMDVRSFYRDLELLRASGIDVPLLDQHYVLDMKASKAFGQLPFPDPHFNLAEAMQLASGRTAAHAKLRKLVAQVVGKGGKKGK
jgi:predicted DNA-binding transcriptional regulator YafY